MPEMAAPALLLLQKMAMFSVKKPMLTETELANIPILAITEKFSPLNIQLERTVSKSWKEIIFKPLVKIPLPSIPKSLEKTPLQTPHLHPHLHPDVLPPHLPVSHCPHVPPHPS